MSTRRSTWDGLPKIAKWLRDQRIEKALGIRNLAAQTNVHPSSISRFERGEADPKLLSLLRLCQGLEVPFEEFCEKVIDVEIPPIPVAAESLTNGGGAIVLTDLRMFVWRLRNQAGSVAQDLSGLLLSVSRELENSTLVPETLAKEVSHDVVHDLASNWVVPYPEKLERQSIEFVYFSGGVLTLKDVGKFISRIREEYNLPLVYLEDKAYISDTSLMRLEQGIVENVLLSDVIAMSEHFPDAKHLIGMYVNALQPYLEAARPDLRHPEREIGIGKWSHNELVVTVNFVWLCRWLQAYTAEDWWRPRLIELLKPV